MPDAKPPIQYRSFTVSDAAIYAQQLALRDQHLHQPFGISFLPEYQEQEHLILHEGAFHGQTLVGTVVAKFFNQDSALVAPPKTLGIENPEAHGLAAILGQMIVHPQYRGHGIGWQLVQRIEHQIAAQGFTQLTLKARDEAVGFYEKLGYSREGELYVFKT
ncbi:MAG: GNAT family N-acetyltransferase, partial [Sumerlaeia bacterium]